MRFLILLFVISFTLQAHADYKDFYHQQKINQEHNKSTPSQARAKDQWFNQTLDHFDPISNAKFQQRYYINDQYALSAGSPVLLYICGEATCNPSSVTRGAIVEYAKTLKAKIVALEHRYYGKSQPFKKLTTKNLKFLTTPQAIEDLANFQNYITSSEGLTGKWIAMGGSYPGSLSAYYRLKYPNLVIGALASSAPVKAKADFFEYDQHVTKVVGVECAQNMRDTVSQVEAVLEDPAKLKAIKKKFNAIEVTGKVDFLYFIADIGAMAAQYGYIKEFCGNLKNAKNPLEGYATFATKILSAWGMNPNSLNISSATSLNPADYERGFGMRQWIYQSCTEYGYWQVADKNHSTRSALIDLDYHNNVCTKLFGITEPVDTNYINDYFFKPLLNAQAASNILFTNGSTDPWSNLSLLPNSETGTNVNDLNTYLLIQGAAHCDDLGGSRPSDSAELTNSRSVFINLIGTWLFQLF